MFEKVINCLHREVTDVRGGLRREVTGVRGGLRKGLRGVGDGLRPWSALNLTRNRATINCQLAGNIMIS